jgi:RNA polymerase sigma factor (sigma-70 family)
MFDILSEIPSQEIEKLWGDLVRYVVERKWIRKEDASDLVQTAFVRILVKGAKDTSPQKLDLPTLHELWVENCMDAARNMRCKKTIYPRLSGKRLEIPIECEGLLHLERHEELEQLRESLKKLPAKEQEILILRYFRGKSLADVGLLTGQRTNNLYDELRSALHKLKHEMVMAAPLVAQATEEESLMKLVSDAFDSLSVLQQSLADRASSLSKQLRANNTLIDIAVQYDQLIEGTRGIANDFRTLSESIRTHFERKAG